MTQSKWVSERVSGSCAPRAAAGSEVGLQRRRLVRRAGGELADPDGASANGDGGAGEAAVPERGGPGEEALASRGPRERTTAPPLARA